MANPFGLADLRGHLHVERRTAKGTKIRHPLCRLAQRGLKQQVLRSPINQHTRSLARTLLPCLDNLIRNPFINER